MDGSSGDALWESFAVESTDAEPELTIEALEQCVPTEVRADGSERSPAPWMHPWSTGVPLRVAEVDHTAVGGSERAPGHPSEVAPAAAAVI